MGKKIILLGAPGSGKGTQAQLLTKQGDFLHISSGDIFRRHIKAHTELGVLAQSFIDHGNLVPDEVTIKMVETRLQEADCQQTTVILDGFPRTLPQAQIFDQQLASQNQKIDYVFYLDVPEAVIIRRLGSRLSCRAHGHVFNTISTPPAQEGICDFDGSELYLRDDDLPETVLARLAVYQKQTAPLVEYYRQQGCLVELDGNRPMQLIAQEILNLLQK